MHKTWSRAVSVGLALAISSAGMPVLAQDAGAQNQTATSTQTSTPETDLPDSPGVVQAKGSGGTQASSTGASSTGASSQKSQQPEPSGTAVAPSVQVSGGAASKPAGVAIAPPKQRQTRSWLIKFGFIAGAGAALGAVAALSAASPSRVPGSH
jgi:hypothetical protein